MLGTVTGERPAMKKEESKLLSGQVFGLWDRNALFLLLSLFLSFIFFLLFVLGGLILLVVVQGGTMSIEDRNACFSFCPFFLFCFSWEKGIVSMSRFF